MARDDRNFCQELFRRRVAPPYQRSESRESKKKVSEEKLMIARLLNVVNVCGSSFTWILFFFFVNDTFCGARIVQSATL